MPLSYGVARILLLAITPGAFLVTVGVYLFSQNPLWLVAIFLLYTVVVVSFIGLRYGFDATRQDVLEEMTGANPGDYDEVTARDFVARVDWEEGNVEEPTRES